VKSCFVNKDNKQDKQHGRGKWLLETKISGNAADSEAASLNAVCSFSSPLTSQCLDSDASATFLDAPQPTDGSDQLFSIPPSFESSDSDDSYQICSPSLKSQPKRAKVNTIADHDVVGALDRVNVPDRGATYIVGAVAKALGHDVGSMTLSRSSIRCTHQKNRKEAAEAVHNDIFINAPLLLHWDGKLLPDIAGKKETVDRIAILVTGSGQEMLLGVPKIGRGTGRDQAETCLVALDDWASGVTSVDLYSIPLPVILA